MYVSKYTGGNARETAETIRPYSTIGDNFEI